jgi:four helix bundle protein
MKFENMEVWKKAVQLSTEIYLANRTIKDYGFKDQIGRSGLSVPSNIAEGMERSSIKESLNFVSYAKASCGELYTQVVIGHKIGYYNDESASRYKSEAQVISKMIAALINKRKEFI